MTTDIDPTALYRSVIADHPFDGLSVEARKAAIEGLVEAHNTHAQGELKRLLKSVTQGEWMALVRLLDMPRAAIGEDPNVTLLAVAYIREKREHGRASLDVLLELTDEQLLAFHGFVSEPDDEQPPASGPEQPAGDGDGPEHG